MPLQLQQIFPLLNSNMTLEQEVKTVNDIRLGFFTSEMQQTELNLQLDEMLPNLTESECCTFLVNLNAAYMKCKLWAEQHRKVRITLEVGERENKKKELAEKKRVKKEKKEIKLEKESNKSNNIVDILAAKKSLQFDSDPARDKAIKEFIKVSGSYTVAVQTLMSLGALPQDYQILDIK